LPQRQDAHATADGLSGAGDSVEPLLDDGGTVVQDPTDRFLEPLDGQADVEVEEVPAVDLLPRRPCVCLAQCDPARAWGA
jgi:hypothetical protein